VAPSAAIAASHVSPLASIRMITPSIGWARAGCHTYRTANGGSTWHDVTPKGFACGSDNIETPSYFLNANRGWLAILRPSPNPNLTHIFIFRTSNGGTSWQSSHFTFGEAEYVSQLDFTDAAHGWMFVVQGVGAGQMQFTIFRTVNGGAGWSRASSSGAGNARNRLPGCDCPNGITFLNASTGWATGNAFARPNALFFYVTHDGGQSWRPQSLPITQKERLNVTIYPPTFFSSQAGVLPVVLRNSHWFGVFVTSNGGRAWQRTSLVAPPGSLEYQASFFIDAKHGWAALGSTLFSTVNGGRSWSVTGHPRNVAQLDFVTNSLGFAVQRNSGNQKQRSFLKTTDGGKSWRVMPFTVR
jgi:photosystem II stability/assembly factor-like uncharacterized protein